MSEGFTLSQFWELWELFRDPTLAGTLMGGLLGFLGVYIIARRMVFLSAALSQTAGLGVVIAFYAQVHWAWTGLVADPLLWSGVLTLFVVTLVWTDRTVDGHRRDALLGLAFLIGAAGMLVVATRITQELQDVQTLLFGSAVAVLPEDFELVVWVVVGLGALHLAGLNGFAAVTFDRDGATVRGLPTRFLELLLLLTLAAAISTCTRVLGALPAFAFSVLPAMAALRLAPNIHVALLLGAVFGALSGYWGYVAAFLYSLPVGASQALVGVGLVIVAALARGVVLGAMKVVGSRG